MKIARLLVRGKETLALDTPAGLFDIPAYFERAGLARVFQDRLASLEKGETALACSIDGTLLSALEELERTTPGECLIDSPVQYLPPVRRPGRIIAIGRNYLAHATETGYSAPREVLFFCKAPSCLVGHNAPIRIPSWVGRVDPEGELAVIIGKSGRNIPEEAAFEHIAGYSIINDVTARTMQEEDRKRHEPWFRSKSIDTFAPMGPFLVPAGYVSDPQHLSLVTRVNGEVRQSSNTSSMIFSIARIVVHVSKFMTLEPGDVIATGTPEGIRPIVPGDVVEIEIESLGTLSNPVVAE